MEETDYNGHIIRIELRILAASYQLLFLSRWFSGLLVRDDRLITNLTSS